MTTKRAAASSQAAEVTCRLDAVQIRIGKLRVLRPLFERALELCRTGNASGLTDLHDELEQAAAQLRDDAADGESAKAAATGA